MIKLLNDLPDNVIGFEYVGEVTADDYRMVLEPVLDKAAAAGHKIRLVAVLGSELTGLKGGAMLEDSKVGLRDRSAWERIALVTDRSSIVESIRFLGWMVPGEIKTFPATDLDAAAKWASES
jgi:hypothetical protein